MKIKMISSNLGLLYLYLLLLTIINNSSASADSRGDNLPSPLPKPLIIKRSPLTASKNFSIISYQAEVSGRRPCSSDAQCAQKTLGAACYQGVCRCKFGHVFGGLNGSHCEPMACASDQDCLETARALYGSPGAVGKTVCDAEAWECRCAPGYSYWTNNFSCDVDLGTVVLWIALAIGVVIVLLGVILFLFLCICYSFKKTVEGVGRRLSSGRQNKGKMEEDKNRKEGVGDKASGSGGGKYKATRNSTSVVSKGQR